MGEGLRFPAEAEAAEVCLGQRGGGVRNTERSRLVGTECVGETDQRRTEFDFQHVDMLVGRPV